MFGRNVSLPLFEQFCLLADLCTCTLDHLWHICKCLLCQIKPIERFLIRITGPLPRWEQRTWWGRWRWRRGLHRGRRPSAGWAGRGRSPSCCTETSPARRCDWAKKDLQEYRIFLLMLILHTSWSRSRPGWKTLLMSHLRRRLHECVTKMLLPCVRKKCQNIDVLMRNCGF